MKNIYLLGSLNMDLVIKTPYIPTKGETLMGNGFIANPGGKGANQAVACSKLGGTVYMTGCVGSDPFGVDLLDNLIKQGVHIKHIRKVENISTGVAVIIITGGDNRIILDSGANQCVSKEDIDNLFSNAEKGDIFITQLENPINIVGYALKKANEIGMYVILDPAPANDYCLDYLSYVDLLTPNEGELSLLSGKNDIKTSCEFILNKGVKELVVTLGEDGYLYYSKDRTFKGNTRKVKVLDSTGAGDTFTGALGVQLASGRNINEAMEFAVYAATLSVTRMGAQTSIPTRGEVIRFMSKS